MGCNPDENAADRVVEVAEKQDKNNGVQKTDKYGSTFLGFTQPFQHVSCLA
ncbi:MAG: hypothetical protein LBQ02_02400 [Candidatus Nomurabacteria bacterium]|nr:hypothetical protein [Candidatus Nomurabacteria bacterium]